MVEQKNPQIASPCESIWLKLMLFYVCTGYLC